MWPRRAHTVSTVAKLFSLLGFLMNGAPVSSRATPQPNIYWVQTLALSRVRIRASSLSLLSCGGGVASRRGRARRPGEAAPRHGRNPAWRRPQPRARPGGGRSPRRARPAPPDPSSLGAPGAGVRRGRSPARHGGAAAPQRRFLLPLVILGRIFMDLVLLL